MIHWVGKHSAGKKSIHCTVVGSQRTKVEIPLVKVQGLRSLVYDVMSGVVDLQGSVSVWSMWQVNSHYNVGHVYCLVHVTRAPHIFIASTSNCINKVQVYNPNNQC